MIMPRKAPAPVQIPPADELASVRDQIAALEKRERELRTLMLTDKSARTGNRYLAEVVSVEQQRTDLKEMRKMHPALVAEYTFAARVEKVELREITPDGEIIRRRKQKRTEP